MWDHFHETPRFKVERGGWLRLWILQLLVKREMTGAEIINYIHELTAGRWKPSPGSVYPILKSMVEEGYLKYREERNSKVYSLTEKGRKELENMGVAVREENADEIIETIENYVEYLGELYGEQILRDDGLKGKVMAVITHLKQIVGE
ncbi:PadR family transcriptional regulator [Sulfolobales archaeon HS-7]|nr:PadR family transcriptional regulator [Sulfolobales archaeon HS-7]